MHQRMLDSKVQGTDLTQLELGRKTLTALQMGDRWHKFLGTYRLVPDGEVNHASVRAGSHLSGVWFKICDLDTPLFPTQQLYGEGDVTLPLCKTCQAALDWAGHDMRQPDDGEDQRRAVEASKRWWATATEEEKAAVSARMRPG